VLSGLTLNELISVLAEVWSRNRIEYPGEPLADERVTKFSNSSGSCATVMCQTNSLSVRTRSAVHDPPRLRVSYIDLTQPRNTWRR
jgi:hypothetical protein